MKASAVCAILSLSGVMVGATHLSDSRLSKVYDVMNAISTHSWENGTKSEAILEWTYPTLSVFTSTGNPFPGAGSITSGQISQIIDIAQTTLQNRPASNTSAAARGGSSLLQDDAAGDPASLGIAVLLANLTTGDAQVNGVGYGDAATQELNYLLYDVPRVSGACDDEASCELWLYYPPASTNGTNGTSNATLSAATTGAISHRAQYAQLWSDSVFMVPPFLAAYGVWSANQTLLQTAYTQCALYRQYLRTSSGLWMHIVGSSSGLDYGLWATGNAWAAYGMLRVWASIYHSPYRGEMGSQMADLASWSGEIVQAAEQYITSDGLFHNYINDTSTFEDAAGAALMAATGLRLSTLNITNNYVPAALTLLSGVSDKVNSTGYLTQVVNPNSFGAQGTESPEGQSFVIMAYSAFKEWEQRGQSGFNGSGDPLGMGSAAGRRVGPVLGLGLESGWGWMLGLGVGLGGVLWAGL
ncbi:hypothetical protein JCM24511_08745 [Saitozyma sp. JCM 24511]|nr:hypothetical protein JCM24511_08745 [Saitozyma sp. JCM 24511]